MKVNITDYDYQLSSCGEGEDVCNTIPWEASIITVNVISIFVNLMHMIILSRMKSLRGTAYLLILIHISVADFLCGFTFSIKMSCLVRQAAFYNRKLAAFISMLDFPLFMKYFTLATAVIERLDALCRPVAHDSSLYVRRMPIWLGLLWAFAITVAVIRDIAFYKHLCMGMSIGPSNVDLPVTAFIAMCMSFVPSIIIAICLIIIAVRLSKLKKIAAVEEQKSFTTATKFVVIISIMFLLCLVPLIVSLLVQRFSGGDFVEGDDAASAAWLAQSIYSVLNTLVYGLLTKAYRDEIKSLFKKNDPNKVGTVTQAVELSDLEK